VREVGPRGGMYVVPGPDGLCNPCRGREQAWWPEAWEPKDCCIAHSRLVRTWSTGKHQTEKEQYHLAGDHVWYICEACHRTHPFDPARGKGRRNDTAALESRA
jgi:hypothetical protein